MVAVAVAIVRRLREVCPDFLPHYLGASSPEALEEQITNQGLAPGGFPCSISVKGLLEIRLPLENTSTSSHEQAYIYIYIYIYVYTHIIMIIIIIILLLVVVLNSSSRGHTDSLS